MPRYISPKKERNTVSISILSVPLFAVVYGAWTMGMPLPEGIDRVFAIVSQIISTVGADVVALLQAVN